MRDEITRLLDESTPPVSSPPGLEAEIARLVRASRPLARRRFLPLVGVVAVVGALIAGATVATALGDKEHQASAPRTQTLEVSPMAGPSVTAQIAWISTARMDPTDPAAETFAEGCISTVELQPEAGSRNAAQVVARAKLFLDYVDLSDVKEDPAYAEAFGPGPVQPGADEGAREARQIRERFAVMTVVVARLNAYLHSKGPGSIGGWMETGLSCEGDQ